MSNEKINEIITKLNDEKTVVKAMELVDNVIALQLERILELNNDPEIQEDAMTNLIELLILRKDVY